MGSHQSTIVRMLLLMGTQWALIFCREEGSVYRLSFGSCFWHTFLSIDSDIFRSLADRRPDSFVWLGDAAYTDVFNQSNQQYSLLPNRSRYPEIYERSKNDPNYALIRDSTKIYGTWDDHDFGIDNGGKDNPVKDELRQHFLDFLDEPKDSPRRTRQGGLYESYFLDKDKKIKLILLDNRYSKDEESDPRPEDEKTTLGEEQEEWLRQEIMNSTAYFTVVAAGMQIIPDDRLQEHFYRRSREVVLSTPNPRTRLVLISGDVHYGEVLVDQCSVHLRGYPVKEYTSSGITHSEAEDPKWWHLVYHWGLWAVPDVFNSPVDRYGYRNLGMIDFHIASTLEASSYRFYLLSASNEVVLEDSIHPQYFGRSPLSSPDIPAYRYCREELKRYHPRWAIISLKIMDWNDPITQIAWTTVSILAIGTSMLWRIFIRKDIDTGNDKKDK